MKITENQPNTYTVVVEKSNTGFSALVNELPVYTTGANLQEIEDNIQEALQLYLTESSKFEIKLEVRN
jgi:predicted RNase H-like HicB family nuclease